MSCTGIVIYICINYWYPNFILRSLSIHLNLLSKVCRYMLYIKQPVLYTQHIVSPKNEEYFPHDLLYISTS